MPVSRTEKSRPTSPSGDSPSTSTRHHHLAPVGELDRVAHQVEQHLPQPARIADQGVGHVRLDVPRQLQPLAVGPRGQRPQGIADLGPQGEFGRVQLQLAGGDLGEIEQVGDDAQQALARRLDRVQALPLVLGQRRVEDQVGHAEDGIQGRADLVADVGQELVLGAVGRLRRLPGPPRLLLQPLALGDVLEDRDRIGGPARRVALQRDRQIDPDQRAVLAEIALLQRVAGRSRHASAGRSDRARPPGRRRA